MQTPFSVFITPTSISIGWVPLLTASELGNDTLIHYKLEKSEFVTPPVFVQITPYPTTATSY